MKNFENILSEYNYSIRPVLGDWNFVGRQLMLAGKYMFTNPHLALKAFGLGIGLGSAALPKTFYYPIRSIYR